MQFAGSLAEEVKGADVGAGVQRKGDRQRKEKGKQRDGTARLERETVGGEVWKKKSSCEVFSQYHLTSIHPHSQIQVS